MATQYLAVVASKDTFISESSPTDNNGSSLTVLMGHFLSGSSELRGLFEFDISSLPVGAVLVSGETAITLTNAAGMTIGGGTRDGHLYKMKRNFVELQATYNIYSTGNNWGTQGALGAADIDTTLGHVFVWPGAEPVSFTGTTIDAMVEDAVTNEAGILRVWAAFDRTTGVEDSYYCHSRGNATPSNRPTITVAYTFPVPATSRPGRVLNGRPYPNSRPTRREW